MLQNYGLLHVDLLNNAFKKCSSIYRQNISLDCFYWMLLACLCLACGFAYLASYFQQCTALEFGGSGGILNIFIHLMKCPLNGENLSFDVGSRQWPGWGVRIECCWNEGSKRSTAERGGSYPTVGSGRSPRTCTEKNKRATGCGLHLGIW